MDTVIIPDPDQATKTKTKIETFNERFDRFTKEKKIANLFLVAIIYFLLFLAVDLLSECSILYLQSGELDLLYFDNFYLPALLMITAFLMLLPRLPQLICTGVIAAFHVIYSFAQCVVYNTNADMFRFNTILSMGEAGDFAAGAIANVPKGVIAAHIIALFVVAAAVFASAKIERPKKGLIYGLVYSALCVAVTVIGLVLTVDFSAFYFAVDDDGSREYDKFKFDYLTDLCYTFGISDLYTYNVQDIRLSVKDAIGSSGAEEEIDAYFTDKATPEENDMTGVLKGKNLIVIQMESIDYRLIDEGFCPNMEKLMGESIYFENYYAVRYGNTLTFGTETAINTTVTGNTGVNLSQLDDHSYPFSLASMFSAQGYNCNEFHGNAGTFYNRENMALTYGYDNFYDGNALLPNGDPFNDLELISDDSVYEKMFGGDEPYLTYYVTFTSHEPMLSSPVDTYYAQALNKHPEYADLELTQINRWKLRSTITDDMIGELMEKLEADGTLDDTAILFVSDHVSIANSDDTVNDEDNLSNRVPCFLYCKDLEPQTVTKPCEQFDLLPTLLNLYGIDYTAANYYFGTDIFSSDEGFVYFPDMSWITDTCYYENGSVNTLYADEEPDDDYIAEKNEEVKNRILINKLVLYSDYYSKFDSDDD